MRLSAWLSSLQHRNQSQRPRVPRRRSNRAVLQLTALEDRCLLSWSGGGFVDPKMPDPTTTLLSDVCFVGGGNTGLPPVPTTKTLTFTNNTDETIYPILRDANVGKSKNGNYYDPKDPHNQEFRGYIGYVKDGIKYIGLQPHTTATISVPLVFWDGGNVYIATDGRDMIPANAAAPNPFEYNPNSVRFITNATKSTYGNGLVMFYTVKNELAHTPTPDSPAQLTEFTIRDEYLKHFGVNDDQTFTLINYDVSYVDSNTLSVAMQATNVPIPNTNQSQSFGWIGSTEDQGALQQQLQTFVSNSDNELGQYFNGRGWPVYFNPPPRPGGLKIPSGANVFANSPFNDTRSKYNNLIYALSSGGIGQLEASAGGTANKTKVLSVDFTSTGQRDAFFAVLQSWKTSNEDAFARTTVDRATVLGKITDFAPTGPLTGTVTLNQDVAISGGFTFEFFRPVTDYASTRMRNIWYSWANYYVNSFNTPSVTFAGSLASTSSTILTLNSDPQGAITVGMGVSGEGIKPGTTVASIDPGNPRLITLSRLPAITASGNYTFNTPLFKLTGTVSSVNSNVLLLDADPKGKVLVGMNVSGNGILPCTVLAIDRKDPRKIYLSQLPTATASGEYTFNKPNTILYSTQFATPPALTFAAGPDTDNARLFAGSVYEAMAAESMIPMDVNAKAAFSYQLVQTVIGCDVLHLPKANDFLGGQVRDKIKSILRGVYDFEVVPESSGQWYPDPSLEKGRRVYNVYNLNPYVWFVHKKLGLSGYGFSVDDDTSDVGANGAQNLLFVVSGKSGLDNPNEWFPSLYWGEMTAQAQIFIQNGVAYIQLLNATKYQQIKPDDPANAVTGAYVWADGYIPAGTNLKDYGPLSLLQFKLSTANGVVPTNGAYIKLTFTGKNVHP